jgi:hypothetical protein
MEAAILDQGTRVREKADTELRLIETAADLNLDEVKQDFSLGFASR